MNKLDADSIREPLTGVPGAQLDILEVFSDIESTNSYLLDQPPPAPGRFRVALADHQTAGRGRRDRTWISPPASGLYLSLAYTFKSAPDYLPSLTLALGIGVAEALERLGIRGIGLKWPNDIVAHGGKLGGILTEMQSNAVDGTTIVAGVGLNIDLPEEIPALVASSWTSKIVDLKSCTSDPPSRETLSVAVIEDIVNCMIRFESNGFASFERRWEHYDWLKGKRITVDMPDSCLVGIADGVSEAGELNINTAHGRRRVITAEIKLPDEVGDKQ